LLSFQTLVEAAALTGVVMTASVLYSRYLKRYPTATDIPASLFNGRTRLRGKVVHVGDGDNFRFFHTPGGALAGWEWLRKIAALRANKPRRLTPETISVRLCGADAPEAAHFGYPAQKYSAEARAWLNNYVNGRYVTLELYSLDQYRRAVACAYIWTWTGRKDVSLEMIRAGWAVVYESKMGAAFGSSEELYRAVEANARRARAGIWQDGGK
ncbi:uncharacterized protein V1510DRAFT_349234, partial [Dipodascopsis tothii]|uniref:uncharacterized protein n=1 Tax=Dipodascopsis tothii TaxID=44089 RepID=UPI0034CF1853